jgi:hypothetical protein
MFYYIFSLIVFIIFFPILGSLFLYLSYITWTSNIETNLIIEKNYEFFYVIAKFVIPLYSIWAFLLTIKIIKRSFLILNRRSSDKENLNETIKKLQNAIDLDFKK